MICSVTADGSPTARALLALETIQNVPGITSELLGERLGVTERGGSPLRRHPARGRPAHRVRHRAQRRLPGRAGPPPVAAHVHRRRGDGAGDGGHRRPSGAADPTDLVGAALAKILRVLPERVAEPVMRYRDVAHAERQSPQPDAELTSRLIAACTAARRLRIRYDTGRTDPRRMDVDPWAVVLRHSYWYLLCWSHTVNALRVSRVDRVVSVDPLPETFAPPEDLDALRTLEEHLSQGWRFEVDVLVDSPPEHTPPLPLSQSCPSRTCRRGQDATACHYQRAGLVRPPARRAPVPWRVIASPELRRAPSRRSRADLGRAASTAGSRSGAKPVQRVGIRRNPVAGSIRRPRRRAPARRPRPACRLRQRGGGRSQR